MGESFYSPFTYGQWGKKVINTVHVNINPGFVKIDQM